MSTPQGPPGSAEQPGSGHRGDSPPQPVPPGYPGGSEGFPAPGPPPPWPHQGYPPGYPPQGPQPGRPPAGYPQQGYPPQHGYPQQGYPQHGYPQHGFPAPGYPPQNHPPQSYSPQNQPPPSHPPQDYPPLAYPAPAAQAPQADPRQPAPQLGSPSQPPETGGQRPVPDREPRRGRVLPWLLGGVAAAGVAVVLILGFVVPGFFTTTVFDQQAVQDGVRRILTDEYGQNADAVRCPLDQQVRQGSTFTCTATIDDKLRTVLITVKTDSGEYEVARPN